MNTVRLEDLRNTKVGEVARAASISYDVLLYRVSVPVREVVFVQSILFGTRLCALRVAGDKVWYLHFYNGFMELNVSHTKPPDCQSK